jgi:hypothetical protein
MMEDGRDPIEKLNDLRTWLRDNKVESAPKPVKTTGGIRITGQHARPTSAAASGEIADFEQWVNDIQSTPTKSWFANS